MSSARMRRLGVLLLAVALVAVAAPAAPATAENPQEPYAGASLYAQSIAIGTNESTAGKTAALHVYGCCTGQSLPDRVTVKVDATGAAGVLVVAVSGSSCSVSAAVTACDVPFLNGFQADGDLQVNLKVAAGAKVGDQATLKLDVSGTGLNSTSNDAVVTVVASDADLVARSFTTAVAAPGDVRTYQPEFRNSGDASAAWVSMTINDGGFTRFTQRYSNCRYRDSSYGSTGYCEFNVNLAPGETARVTTPIGVTVQSDVPDRGVAWSYYYLGVLDGPSQGDFGVPGNGPPLVLDKVTAGGAPLYGDADWSDNQGNVEIPAGPNPGDLAAVGGAATGPEGSQLSLVLGLRNNGPAMVPGELDGEGLSPDAPSQPSATITFPTGTTLLYVPNGMQEPRDGNMICAPVINGRPDWTMGGNVVGLVYRCTASNSPDAGETEPIQFKVSIPGTATLTGTIVVSGGTNDPNPANNTAQFTMTPTAKISHLPVLPTTPGNGRHAVGQPLAAAPGSAGGSSVLDGVKAVMAGGSWAEFAVRATTYATRLVASETAGCSPLRCV